MNLYNQIIFKLKYEKATISFSDFNVTPIYFYNTISQLITNKNKTKGFFKLNNKNENFRQIIIELLFSYFLANAFFPNNIISFAFLFLAGFIFIDILNTNLRGIRNGN